LWYTSAFILDTEISKTNLNMLFEVFLDHPHDQMTANSVTLTQTTHAFNDNVQTLMDILKEYSDLYMEIPSSIYGYFDQLLSDQKPAVSIEIYNRSTERVEAFKAKLEDFFFVFGTYENKGSYESYHLSVSKIRSIAKYVHIIEKDGFADSAGAIGLLLGYNLNQVMDYLKKTNEDSIKDIQK
jgi:hypothetical protein